MNGHIERWLDAYLDDELEATLRSQVETHLTSCLDCQKLLAQRSALSTLLLQVPAAQGLKPEARFAAEVGLLIAQRPHLRPSVKQELRQWLFNDTSRNLGWLAVPIGLLLAGIFIQTVAGLSSVLALIPGPHQEILRQISMAQPVPVLANPQLWSGMLSGLGWFDLLQWDWLSELLALGAISLLYLAWLAGWLVHNQRRFALQDQINALTGKQ